MSATVISVPAAKPAPESVRLPAPGSVVMMTDASAFAGVSFGSVQPKPAAVKVYCVSSIPVTVLFVPAGASLTAVRLIVIASTAAVSALIFTPIAGRPKKMKNS